MNKVLVAALALLGLAGAAGGGYWYGERFGTARKPAAVAVPGVRPAGPTDAQIAASEAPVVTVTMTRVDTGSLPQTITAVGSLRSDESVTLRPEVAGRITEILFQEGQRVTKGTPLVRMDPTINQAEVRQARANLTLARAKYERSSDLANRNFISGQARDEARNNLEIAAAALALAEARLAKMEIKAPFSGIMGLRVVSVGDYVREGTDLVKLEAIDPLKVDFRVPEVFLREVQVNQPIEVMLDALPGKQYDGKVIALDPLLDAAGRSIVLRAQVRNQDTAMRPGMFARVRLITQTTRDALLVPEESLMPQATEQFVYRVVDNRARRTKVETGQRRDGKVEIVAGLTRDDIVVTAGQAKLREGTPVKAETGVLPAAGAPGAPRAPAAGPTSNGQPPGPGGGNPGRDAAIGNDARLAAAGSAARAADVAAGTGPSGAR
ncbi:MAG: efflux RND transporter periplasmic adaptor subunit [Lautropia sp.]